MTTSVNMTSTDISKNLKTLEISISYDAAQFNYIPSFLSELLNLPDATKILQSDDIGGQYYIEQTKEILPDILVPNDVWLRSNITIKDIKIKVSMLTDINSMLEKELSDFDSVMDENVVTYYQKLLTAYKFFETPKCSYNNGMNHLKEDDEEDELDESNKSLNRTTSNQSTVSSKTHHSYISGTTNNGSMSTNQSNAGNLNKRENVLTRRFSSLLGNLSPTPPVLPISPTSPTMPNSNGFSNINTNSSNSDHEEDDGQRQQLLNSILSKSRIYNRIKKNRESSGSQYSSNSNRNSIITSNSNKRNSTISTGEVEKYQPPAFIGLSLNQRQEIQKFKFDYYMQVNQVLSHTNKILAALQNTSDNSKAQILLDFIKRYVFKFIALDVSEMVKSYGEIEAFRLYSRST